MDPPKWTHGGSPTLHVPYIGVETYPAHRVRQPGLTYGVVAGGRVTEAHSPSQCCPLEKHPPPDHLAGSPSSYYLEMLSSELMSFKLRQNRTAALPHHVPMPLGLGKLPLKQPPRGSPYLSTHLGGAHATSLPSPWPFPEPQGLPAGPQHWECRNEKGRRGWRPGTP